MDFKKLVGIVVLLLIIFAFKDSIRYILEVDPTFFLLSVLSYFSLNILLAYRMLYLFKKLGENSSFSSVFSAHMAAIVTSDVTPGRSGYLAFPKFGEKYGLNFRVSTASLFSTQAVEMIVKVFGSSLAILYLLSPEELVAISLPAFLTVLASLYLWTDAIPIKFKRIEKIREYSKLTRRHIPELLFLTVIGWFLVGAQWFFVSKAMNLNLSFFESMLLQALLSLAMFIPLTPAGAGFFEGGTAFVFSTFGVSPEKAIAFALLIRASTIIADSPGIYFILSRERVS